MGLVEKFKQQEQQKIEETTRIFRTEQEKRVAAQKTLDETNATNLPLLQKAKKYFFESTIPQMLYDFKGIEPRRYISTASFTKGEWKNFGGPSFNNQLMDWLVTKDFCFKYYEPSKFQENLTYAIPSPDRPIPTEVDISLVWRLPSKRYECFYINCNHSGTLTFRAGKDESLTYLDWKTDHDLICDALIKAYKNPWSELSTHRDHWGSGIWN